MAERIRCNIERQGHYQGRSIVPGSVRVSVHDPGDLRPLIVNVTAQEVPRLDSVTITGIVSV